MPSKFGCMSADAYGRPLEVFALPKDVTITLVSGYSVVMRHRIVTRWQELESQAVPQVPAIPQTFAEALRLAADTMEQNQRLEAQRTIDAPKVAVFDAVVAEKRNSGRPSDGNAQPE